MAFYLGSTNVIDTDPVFDHEHVNESKLWTKSSETNLGGIGAWSATTVNTYTNGLQPDHNNWEHWFITFKCDLIGTTDTYGFTSNVTYQCKESQGNSDAKIMFNGGNSYPLNVESAWLLHIQSWRQPNFVGPHELIITPYRMQDTNPTDTDWGIASPGAGTQTWWGTNGSGVGPNFAGASASDHSIDLIFPTWNGGTNLSIDIYATWK